MFIDGQADAGGDVEGSANERGEEYRHIFEATGDGLLIADFDGRIIAANAAACRIYGYPREELVGLSLTALVEEAYVRRVLDDIRIVQTRGSLRGQVLNRRKDGTLFPMEVHATRFTYRGSPHLLSVVRDVTERVQARELLEQRVAERTRELTTLLEISRNVTSTLELQPLLDLILEQLKEVVNYAGAGIIVQEGEEVRIVGYQGRGPVSRQVALGTRIPASQVGPLWALMQSGEPIVIADVQEDAPDARAYRQTVGDALKLWFAHVRSWMAVPMRVKDRGVGFLFLEHGEQNAYTKHHADLALAIAQQAAIAIENARLYERAQEAAIVEERQRLSRELHDSVSQALYSIALSARTARALVDRDPGRVGEPLDFVLAQAERGLAEMRALIFELRPEVLEQDGLVSALTRQTDALQARHQLRAEVILGEEPEVTLPAKEALYRIAQEALQNIAKHARATQVRLALTCTDDAITLEVRDNGTGFEPHGSFPGHLGLRSMRERVERLGGKLELESAAGAGTAVRASLPRRGSTTVSRPESQETTRTPPDLA